MKLSQKDTDTYFRLMWSLQCFTNEEHDVIPQAKSIDEYADYSMDDKVKVRDVLFKNPKLIKQFVEGNPNKLSDEELSIVAGWQNFISDSFFIERCLKKHAIFISGDDVYAVLGLNEGLAEMIPTPYLPLYVRAILLPFKGKIIYDGIFRTSNVIIGNNIMADLKDVYMTAKHEKRIITNIP